MLSHKKSLDILKKTNALLEGHFILSSGLHSSKYIQCAKLLKKETIFCERVNGKFKLRRGFNIKKNSKVLIMEDVITTGKSSLECSKLVSFNEGTIVGYACIINRSNGKSKINAKIISQIDLDIPTFTKDKLPKDLSTIKPVKPGSRNL